ncbi:MAG: helix-turn-helix domain-containing protein [Vicinamibacterales bacterium]
MSQSFGTRLRQRREAQRIALTTIARQTKIKLSLLDALERDDLSHWPAGLYRRAFIRTYAQAIGLDPDVTARELAECHPELAPVPAETTPAAATADGTDGPASRLRTLVGSAFSRLRRSHPAEPPAPVETPCAQADEEDFDFPELAEALSEPVPPPVVQDAVVEAAVETPPAAGLPPFEPDLAAIARLCTQVCRVESPDDVKPLLQEAARILDATGVIVWLWDDAAGGLRAALSHGYSDRMVAQLPAVRRDADNATAATFRTAHVQAIPGALGLPLIVPGGCAGVLAIELLDGREQAKAVRAVATIFAALLAQLVGGSRPDEVDANAAVTAPESGQEDDDRSAYARATLTH